MEIGPWINWFFDELEFANLFLVEMSNYVAAKFERDTQENHAGNIKYIP